jgi:hypothetical protein
MAGPYVTGPAHLFIGLPVELYPLVQVVLGGQGPTLSQGPQPQGASSPGLSGGSTAGMTSQPAAPPGPTNPVANIAIVSFRQPVYLGTAEASPRISDLPSFFSWYADEAGPGLPTDELYEGSEALISADINRWNEPVYAALAQTVNPAPGGAAPGWDPFGAVGTSLVMEGFTHPLWVQFPYAIKLAMGTRGLVGGYRFYNCKLIAPRMLDRLGHEPAVRRLVWKASRYYDLASGISGLYDTDMSGLPTID